MERDDIIEYSLNHDANGNVIARELPGEGIQTFAYNSNNKLIHFLIQYLLALFLFGF